MGEQLAERWRARQAADVGGNDAALTLFDQGHEHFRGRIVGRKMERASRMGWPPFGSAS
jgi:hypothetical protein